jgi:RND family efflux transporter MFP subunit
MKLPSIPLIAVAALMAQETTTVTSQTLARKSRLPGELHPFLRVSLQARVAGFVETVEVDRGSVVKKGDTIVRLSAPELGAQIAAAEARVVAITSQRAEAEAKLSAAESTYQRLIAASATPGVVTMNEVEVAAKASDAIRGQLAALESTAQASRAAIKPLREMESFLEVKAPFDGTVVERMAHPGALVGPGAGPLVTIEQHGKLRLVVAVPEADAAAIPRGASVPFKVPAHPGRSFTGVVARNPNSMDSRTRTMPVELDVVNSGSALAPGMYAEVEWPVRRQAASLLVPPAAVATTTERSFVIRVRDGKAEWVNVAKGAPAGADLVEVFGALAAGDVILRRATDEIRDGAPIRAAAR